MKSDGLYNYTFSVTNLLYEQGKKRVVEITENGKCIELNSKTGQEIPIQVNTIIVSFARRVSVLNIQYSLYVA